MIDRIETRADVIRGRLARLRELDPDEAREVEALWPLTLASLSWDDAERAVLGRPAVQLQEQLAAELAERLTDHAAEGEAA